MRKKRVLHSHDRSGGHGGARPLWKKSLEILGGGALGAATLFAIIDSQCRLRDNVSRAAAYRTPPGDPAGRARLKTDIQYRIAILLRPDEGPAAITGTGMTRDIEIGFLYGRLALLEEVDGDLKARDGHMADAIRFLRYGGAHDASETYVRDRLRGQL
jgi:hypothetical protein